MEQEADLAKAEQAARAETLRDTAPVLDANKVTSLNLTKLPHLFNAHPEGCQLAFCAKTF